MFNWILLLLLFCQWIALELILTTCLLSAKFFWLVDSILSGNYCSCLLSTSRLKTLMLMNPCGCVSPQ